MQDNNIIADKLGPVIREMLIRCRSLSPKPSEYIIFPTQDQKDPQWLILVLFPDATQLNEAIQNGVCYQIHQYIWNNLNQMDDFKHLRKAIFFEPGSLPKEENELNEIFSAAYEKLDALVKEAGETNPKSCNICGHDLGGHQMLGIPDEATGVPSEGWMICREAHCNCFRTWSVKINGE